MIKGSLSYPKHQIDVINISGWLGLKMGPLTLCCKTLDVIIGGKVGQKYNVNLKFWFVTWVWKAPQID